MTVSAAVLEQGERLDGSGYPRKLTAEKISLYGKILSVTTSYTAAISKRPFRENLDGHSGIMDLLKGIGKRYDEKVLKALVLLLSVYPVGTHVLLTNGAKGVVVKTSPQDPKHPVVKLLINEDGHPYMKQPMLQTSADEQIQIRRTLKEPEVAEIHKKLV